VLIASGNSYQKEGIGEAEDLPLIIIEKKNRQSFQRLSWAGIIFLFFSIET